MLNCIDNSGAAIVECVAVMRKKKAAAAIGVLSILSHQKCQADMPFQATESLSSFRNNDPSAPTLQAADQASESPTKYEEATYDMLSWCEQEKSSREKMEV